MTFSSDTQSFAPQFVQTPHKPQAWLRKSPPTDNNNASVPVRFTEQHLGSRLKKGRRFHEDESSHQKSLQDIANIRCKASSLQSTRKVKEFHVFHPLLLCYERPNVIKRRGKVGTKRRDMVSLEEAVRKDGLDYRQTVIRFPTTARCFCFIFSFSFRFQGLPSPVRYGYRRNFPSCKLPGVKLTTDFSLKSRLRKSGAVPLLPHTASTKGNLPLI